MVHMQPPAADLQLPYSSEWDLELLVTEHWNTTNSAQGSLRASAKVRSLSPPAAAMLVLHWLQHALDVVHWPLRAAFVDGSMIDAYDTWCLVQVGDVVSIYPLEQWAAKKVMMRLRLKSRTTKFTGALLLLVLSLYAEEC